MFTQLFLAKFDDFFKLWLELWLQSLRTVLVQPILLTDHISKKVQSQRLLQQIKHFKRILRLLALNDTGQNLDHSFNRNVLQLKKLLWQLWHSLECCHCLLHLLVRLNQLCLLQIIRVAVLLKPLVHSQLCIQWKEVWVGDRGALMRDLLLGQVLEVLEEVDRRIVLYCRVDVAATLRVSYYRDFFWILVTHLREIL